MSDKRPVIFHLINEEMKKKKMKESKLRKLISAIYPESPIDYSRLYKILKFIHNPTPLELLQIARVLTVTVTDLIDEDLHIKHQNAILNSTKS